MTSQTINQATAVRSRITHDEADEEVKVFSQASDGSVDGGAEVSREDVSAFMHRDDDGNISDDNELDGNDTAAVMKKSTASMLFEKALQKDVKSTREADFLKAADSDDGFGSDDDRNVKTKSWPRAVVKSVGGNLVNFSVQGDFYGADPKTWKIFVLVQLHGKKRDGFKAVKGQIPFEFWSTCVQSVDSSDGHIILTQIRDAISPKIVSHGEMAMSTGNAAILYGGSAETSSIIQKTVGFALAGKVSIGSASSSLARETHFLAAHASDNDDFERGSEVVVKKVIKTTGNHYVNFSVQGQFDAKSPKDSLVTVAVKLQGRKQEGLEAARGRLPFEIWSNLVEKVDFEDVRQLLTEICEGLSDEVQVLGDEIMRTGNAGLLYGGDFDATRAKELSATKKKPLVVRTNVDGDGQEVPYNNFGDSLNDRLANTGGSLR